MTDSLEKWLDDILPAPEDDHRCANCDGQNKMARFGCWFNGVHLNGGYVAEVRAALLAEHERAEGLEKDVKFLRERNLIEQEAGNAEHAAREEAEAMLRQAYARYKSDNPMIHLKWGPWKAMLARRTGGAT
jgi:hypothetical protein